MTKPVLVAVDWGTSSFRAYLVAGEGAILDRRETADGILAAAGRFPAVLAAAIGPWQQAHGRIPVLMAGMIGSRQGWQEAPYVACPASPRQLAEGLVRIAAPDLGPVAIVPGISARDGARRPDVIRGEETQVLGALTLSGASGGLYVLPGIHSKWVTVRHGALHAFATYMTGEVFAALRDHTILGRLATPDGTSGRGFARGVAAGAEAGAPGALLNRIFAARTLALFDELAGGDVADYLSGVLIGAELAAAAPAGTPFAVIGGAALEQRYRDAARVLRLTCSSAPPDCIVAGLLHIARAGGLIPGDAS